MQHGNRAALHQQGGGDWYIIATGPSLTEADTEKARQAQEGGARIVVINDNYRFPGLENADYLYAADQKWWEYHLDQVRETFTGELWTQFHDAGAKAFAEEHGINHLPGKGGQGLGEDYLRHGSHGGHQALNLAYVLSMNVDGAPPKRIIMLGYDMGATGQTHWFGLHPPGFTNGNYQTFINQYAKIAEELALRGVEVINCSRETALPQFKRMTIDDI